ncbi:MAG: hypothetical protein KIT84_24075 [Labilithrix sp.]|nr:hypothetical protein [Labilithrix sp.]MCW5814128.1 hypothetical protein [Labilithrix sp.]
MYTPTTELIFSAGRAYCTSCGVPAVADVGDWELHAPKTLEHHARVAALVMLVVTLCFPLAACVSQL